MPFHVTCVCGRQMVVDDDQSGAVLPCTQCGRLLTIPAVPAPPPPPVPEPVPDTLAWDEQPAIVIDTHAERRTLARVDGNHRRLRIVAVALPALALLGVVPVVVALLQPTEFGSVRLERWACVVLLLGVLELCYTVYLLQLPDWSSLRVVSLVTLGITAVYATVAGIRLLAAPGNRIMEYWELDGNAFSSSQEVLWCFMQVWLTGTISYLAGRWAAEWSHRLHDVPKENSAVGR